MKWNNLGINEVKSPNIQLDEQEKNDFCNAYTPDCGSIKQSSICHCGNKKDFDHTLCSTCYAALPVDLKTDVNWCPEIYEAAKQYLNC